MEYCLFKMSSLCFKLNQKKKMLDPKHFKAFQNESMELKWGRADW